MLTLVWSKSDPIEIAEMQHRVAPLVALNTAAVVEVAGHTFALQRLLIGFTSQP
jgi:hypothetical protein